MTIGRWLNWRRRGHERCDTCAHVEYFRSNGDGQVTRLHAFCRCPGGPHQDRPIPAARRCAAWRATAGGATVTKPAVGDPSLTA